MGLRKMVVMNVVMVVRMAIMMMTRFASLASYWSRAGSTNLIFGVDAGIIFQHINGVAEKIIS